MSSPFYLTDEEKFFLFSQNMTPEDVLDGRGLTKSVREMKARQFNLQLIVGPACLKSGHRLRTRSGHCAQCDTSKLRYQARHRETAAVYVAYAHSIGISKIGISTEVEVREKKINFDGYAGAKDWELVFSVVTDAAGMIEVTAQERLNTFRISTTYRKDGRIYQTSKEAFKCGPIRAVEAVLFALDARKTIHEVPFVSPLLKSMPV